MVRRDGRLCYLLATRECDRSRAAKPLAESLREKLTCLYENTGTSMHTVLSRLTPRAVLGSAGQASITRNMFFYCCCFPSSSLSPRAPLCPTASPLVGDAPIYLLGGGF